MSYSMKRVEALLRGRADLQPTGPRPSGALEAEGGCGVTGFACTIPVGGKYIYEPSIQMRNRGNGKGGGIAACGLVPEDMGVSRKVQDEQARAQARQILQDLDLPADMGFILRTAGLERPKREIQRDLNYLTRLWKSVTQRIETAKAPAEIYQESDLVIRTIRDVYNTDIARILCDSAEKYLSEKFWDQE